MVILYKTKLKLKQLRYKRCMVGELCANFSFTRSHVKLFSRSILVGKTQKITIMCNVYLKLLMLLIMIISGDL